MRHYSLDIPPLVLQGIINYVEKGWPTGPFLKAVLEDGRLHAAVMLASEDSLAAIKQILWVLHNEAPSQCWGSPEKVTAWLNLDADSRKTFVDNCPTWQDFVEPSAVPEAEPEKVLA